MLPITLLPAPKPNDFGYTGPAAYNPYFHTTGTVPDYAFTPGFWDAFQVVAVYNITTGNVDHYVEPKQTASELGAQEALRLVQVFIPWAKLEWVRVEEGAIYYADKLTAFVVLPDQTRLNAAAIVNSYYHAGAGVSAESDIVLVESMGLDKSILPVGIPPVQPEPPTPEPPPVAVPATSPVGEPDQDGEYATLPGSEKYVTGETVTEARGTFVKSEKPSPFGKPWSFWLKVE